MPYTPLARRRARRIVVATEALFARSALAVPVRPSARLRHSAGEMLTTAQVTATEQREDRGDVERELEEAEDLVHARTRIARMCHGRA